MGSDSPPPSSPGDLATLLKKDCSTCRFAATDRRKQIIDATGFGDQMMFKDPDKVTAKDSDGNEYEREVENEIVYSCKATANARGLVFDGLYAGKVIGTVPIYCEAWDVPKPLAPEKAAELDRLIAAREARTKNRKDEERG